MKAPKQRTTKPAKETKPKKGNAIKDSKPEDGYKKRAKAAEFSRNADKKETPGRKKK